MLAISRRRYRTECYQGVKMGRAFSSQRRRKVFCQKGVAECGEMADEYVKVTVFLATVLLLTALSERFAMVGPRVAVVPCRRVCDAARKYVLDLDLPRA